MRPSNLGEGPLLREEGHHGSVEPPLARRHGSTVLVVCVDPAVSSDDDDLHALQVLNDDDALHTRSGSLGPRWRDSGE